MQAILRSFTLDRLGAALLLAAVILIPIGLIGIVFSAASEGRDRLAIFWLSGGEALLSGCAALVLAAIVFALAVINERLMRIEAALKALAQSRENAVQPIGERDKAL